MKSHLGKNKSYVKNRMWKNYVSSIFIYVTM